LLDLLVTGGLPWRKIQDKDDVLKCKEECHRDKKTKLLGEEVFDRCRENVAKILDYIDSLSYQNKVDYEYIYKLLKLVSC
jgi:hypothetical protein